MYSRLFHRFTTFIIFDDRISCGFFFFSHLLAIEREKRRVLVWVLQISSPTLKVLAEDQEERSEDGSQPRSPPTTWWTWEAPATVRSPPRLAVADSTTTRANTDAWFKLPIFMDLWCFTRTLWRGKAKERFLGSRVVCEALLWEACMYCL